MGGGQWGLTVITELLVKLVVLFLRDVLFSARPERCSLVNGFPLAGWDHRAGLVVFSVFPLFLGHQNRQRNMVGVFVDDAFELVRVEVFAAVFLEVQRDTRTSIGALNVSDIKLTRAVTGPAHALLYRQARAATFDGNAVGDDVT